MGEVKHFKGAIDAKRGKIFSKLGRKSPSPPSWAAATRT